MKTRIWLSVAAMLLMAACASDAPGPAPAPATPATSPPPPPPPPPTRPSNDMCGLAEAQKLVGRSRREIPIPVLPALQRVACTTCPVTMDYNPRRLNFLFDADTGVIREVKCG